MGRFTRTVASKAARAAVRHSAHGAFGKLQRRPLRSTTLLSIGVLVGAGAGGLMALRTRRSAA